MYIHELLQLLYLRLLKVVSHSFLSLSTSEEASFLKTAEDSSIEPVSLVCDINVLLLSSYIGKDAGN